MKLGLFLMPSHPPERGLHGRTTNGTSPCCATADRLGYSEAWIGEHFTAPLGAQSRARPADRAGSDADASSIKLAPGAHLLPYHHPAELACRVAFMDHLAEGRYMLGIGASGLPSDWQLFCVDGMKGENRDMTREALDIMLKIWASRRRPRVQGQVLERERAGADARAR